MNKRSVLVLVAAAFSILFVAAVLNAGTESPDVIKLETKAYPKHTMSPVSFSHKKHTADYGVKCGECHHDAKGKTLADLKEGDKVKACIECHKTPGMKPSGVDDKNKIQYHGEAMHANCIQCHRDFNKKMKAEGKTDKKAPVLCNQCHVGGKLK
jgi:hypothetical protein